MNTDLRIRILDVGQGGAIVGILPGGTRAFVVDVFDADRVLDFLESEGIAEVVLFLTHSDRDHTLGAQALLTGLLDERNRTKVLAILFSRDRLSAVKESAYRTLVQFIGQAGKRLSRQDPSVLNGDFNTLLNRIPAFRSLFAPVRVLVVHPEKADQDSLIGVNTNETAGVLLIEYTIDKGVIRRVLLTADVQLTGISLLLDRVANMPVQADVLKYPHHGAWPTMWPGIKNLGFDVPRRTMADFLNHVMPSVVAFSVGSANPHGHIRPETLDLLLKYHEASGRLRSVKWTQLTSACLAPGALPSDGPLAERASAGDIEVRLGTYPTEDFVSIACSGE